jgi:hypothetical protein
VDEELDALRKRDAESQGNQRAHAASSSRGGTLEDRLKRAEGLARVKNGGTMAGGGAHLMSVSLADKGDMGAVDGDEWQAMSFGGGGEGDAQPRKVSEDGGGKEGKGGGGWLRSFGRGSKSSKEVVSPEAAAPSIKNDKAVLKSFRETVRKGRTQQLNSGTFKAGAEDKGDILIRCSDPDHPSGKLLVKDVAVGWDANFEDLLGDMRNLSPLPCFSSSTPANQTCSSTMENPLDRIDQPSISIPQTLKINFGIQTQTSHKSSQTRP